MDLYLIRHAEAVSMDEGHIAEDADRPLTPTGHEQAQALAAGLQRRGVHLDLVLSSPLLRARQTAEEMLQRWSAPAPDLHLVDTLAPGVKPKKLARALREQDAGALALVGHMPDLGLFAAWLLGHGKVKINLAKAGVALIRCDPDPDKGNGSLVWLVTPEWLGK
jgi:phosphohistidine phosphatase